MTGPGSMLVSSGVQCAIADGVENFAEAVRDSRTAFSTRAPSEGLPGGYGGWIRHDLAERTRALRDVSPGLLQASAAVRRRGSRTTCLAVMAAVEAWTNAALPDVLDHEDSTRTGLIIAGTNLDLARAHAEGRRLRAGRPARPSYAAQMWDSNLAGVVSDVLTLRGECAVVGGSSASGNVALIQAMRWIRWGVVDRCLVVAPSTVLDEAERSAFTGMGVVGEPIPDDAHGSHPFDVRHRGFVLAEGAAAVVLEHPQVAAARGLHPTVALTGGATRMHATSSTDPDADTEAATMVAALGDAGQTHADVDLISAHATSTPAGDLAEAEAITAVFGATIPPVIATKALTGHTLGAAAVIELLAAAIALDDGVAHGTPGFTQPHDPQLPVVPPTGTRGTFRVALSNSYGFGGINSSVVIARNDEKATRS